MANLIKRPDKATVIPFNSDKSVITSRLHSFRDLVYAANFPIILKNEYRWEILAML